MPEFVRDNAGKAFEFMVEKVDEDRKTAGLSTISEAFAGEEKKMGRIQYTKKCQTLFTLSCWPPYVQYNGLSRKPETIYDGCVLCLCWLRWYVSISSFGDASRHRNVSFHTFGGRPGPPSLVRENKRAKGVIRTLGGMRHCYTR